jgi:hypothetical protein
MRHGQEESRAGMGNRVFKGDLSRTSASTLPGDGSFFLLLRFDRRDLVAGVALVDVDERAQPNSGQLSDADCAYPANFAARRQTGF